ncbi:uncharacterized protein LOC120846603 [Ixodes scapularis]|uniref:uncharacterized protein LOC120846603 n=1 Tax=Ixodes scapularis TaxID=6945 RepID=UPI001A9F51D8|nr:uncharacterized protein LOC120846603 [Ixodes scapularis]
MRSNILLCVIFIYQLTGVSSLQKLSFEDFIDEVLFRTQQNLYSRLGEGWNIFLGTSLQDENGTFIFLNGYAYAYAVGWHYKLKRDGVCGTIYGGMDNRLWCPVRFDKLRVALPRFPGDGGEHYILRVDMTARLGFWQPRGGDLMNYIRYVSMRTNYTMTNRKYAIVTDTPARYHLSKKWAQNLQGVMQTTLKAFLTNGDFYHSITKAVEGMKKPYELHP